MKNLNVLELVKNAHKKSVEQMLGEMLETAMDDNTKKPVKRVKNWDQVAAIEVYKRIPFGLNSTKTLEEVCEERNVVNSIYNKRDALLFRLAKEEIFADWSKSGNSKDFTAVTVIDQNYSRLLGTLSIHYAFKSVDEALVYANCFNELYQKLAILAEKEKGALFVATKLDIFIVELNERVIKVGNTNFEDD